jgi:putative dimethyl sulfoxide reductase chaperone
MENLSGELRILASLLGAPDADAREAVVELAAHYDWLRPAAQELQGLALEEWRAEYARLFASGHPSSPCPPFESAYLSRRLPEPQTQALKQLYKRMGLRTDGVQADYLGSLLECAAYLNTDPAAGKAFWGELWEGHLTCWVPRFCRELEMESRLLLYRIVARRLRELFPAVREVMSAVA